MQGVKYPPPNKVPQGISSGWPKFPDGGILFGEFFNFAFCNSVFLGIKVCQQGQGNSLKPPEGGGPGRTGPTGCCTGPWQSPKLAEKLNSTFFQTIFGGKSKKGTPQKASFGHFRRLLK